MRRIAWSSRHDDVGLIDHTIVFDAAGLADALAVLDGLWFETLPEDDAASARLVLGVLSAIAAADVEWLDDHLHPIRALHDRRPLGWVTRSHDEMLVGVGLRRDRFGVGYALVHEIEIVGSSVVARSDSVTNPPGEGGEVVEAQVVAVRDRGVESTIYPADQFDQAVEDARAFANGGADSGGDALGAPRGSEGAG